MRKYVIEWRGVGGPTIYYRGYKYPFPGEITIMRSSFLADAILFSSSEAADAVVKDLIGKGKQEIREVTVEELKGAKKEMFEAKLRGIYIDHRRYEG